MTEHQKETLENLRSFNSNTTSDEISQMFGNPIKSTLADTTISWEIEQEGKVTRVKAYYLTGELNKIQFLSLDPFWGYTLYYSGKGVKSEI